MAWVATLKSDTYKQEHGVGTPMLDTKELADAIARLINEPGYRAQLRRKDLESAKVFSWETAKLTLNVYEQALRQMSADNHNKKSLYKHTD